MFLTPFWSLVWPPHSENCQAQSLGSHRGLLAGGTLEACVVQGWAGGLANKNCIIGATIGAYFSARTRGQKGGVNKNRSDGLRRPNGVCFPGCARERGSVTWKFRPFVFFVVRRLLFVAKRLVLISRPSIIFRRS